MTKQTQPAESERAKKQKPQVEAVEPQATSENLPQGLLLGSFQAAGRNGSIEGQRALLKDRPWQDAQRQAFAPQISRVQGNRHLQRLIANVRKESGAPGKLVQRQSLIAAIPANLNGVEANAVFRRILTKSSASEQQAAGIPLAELARVLIPPNILSQVKIPSHFITPGDLESLIKALSVLKGTVEPQLPKVIIERIDGLVSFYKSQLNRTPQPVSALRQTIISIALSQVGAVEQKKGAGVDPNDPQKREFRVGGDRLLEYFRTANPNPTGLYHESDVKHVQKPGEPDNVIDWCGIFALWAYKSAGMNVGVWKVGTTIGGVQGFKPVLPSKVKPGDVGIRKEKEHQYLVLEVNGDNLVTIEGNTNSSGSAIGGEIAVQRIRTISGTDYGFLRPNDLD